MWFSCFQIAFATLATGCLCSDKDRAGLMIPIPGYPQYVARIKQFNMYKIPYYLNEDNNWALNICELERALDESRPHCRPRGLVLINPGNPTGKRYYGPFIAALNMARDFSSHFWWGTWQKKRDYPSKRGGLFKTIGATRGKPSHFKRGITETVWYIFKNWSL